MAIVGAAWDGSTGSAQTKRTVVDGVYTDAQAERGKAAYDKDCAFCHLEDLSGQGFAPGLVEDIFKHRWEDGTVGELFSHTNISPYRPAHIHFMIESPGFHKVTTHLFQKGDKYIDTDVVYGVKEPLIVEFQKKAAGEKAPNGQILNEPFYVVNYDFTLQKLAQSKAA